MSVSVMLVKRSSINEKMIRKTLSRNGYRSTNMKPLLSRSIIENKAT